MPAAGPLSASRSGSTVGSRCYAEGLDSGQRYNVLIDLPECVAEAGKLHRGRLGGRERCPLPVRTPR